VLSEQESSSPFFIRQVNTIERKEPVRGKRTATFSPRTSNPILQEHIEVEPPKLRISTTQTWRPSTTLHTLNSRRDFLPSEASPPRHRSVQSSTIFQPPSEAAPSRQRLTLERPAQAGWLLQYTFALPYREEAVAEKPEQRLLRPAHFAEGLIRKNQAQLNRLRQQTVTYT
jgi:hypothetical protein